MRPIVMTSFAFVLGTLPLAIATGASSNSRHSLGTGVIGGTLVATVVSIFFIPMFYWLLETVSSKLFGGKEQALPASDADAAPASGAPAPEAGATHEGS